MKIMWCWRCQLEVPMLDEKEFKEISKLYGAGMSATKAFRKKMGLPLVDLGPDARFEPLRQRYEELTGWKDMHQNAIIHHRISLYGPPCLECGKPLRTPRASFCAGCGTLARSSVGLTESAN